MANAENVIKVLVRSLVALALVALVLWPADFLVWRIRVAAGGGTDQVVVSRFTVASLKGNKEDYYYEGTGPADCSRSLFPQGGNSACWWLRRHTEVIERY